MIMTAAAAPSSDALSRAMILLTGLSSNLTFLLHAHRRAGLRRPEPGSRAAPPEMDQYVGGL
jgi:hypothetical protein